MPLKDKDVKVLKSTVAGGIAGAFDVLIVYPIHFITTQLHLDRYERKYDGTIDCVRKTIQRHGFVGLYRGMSIILLQSIAKVGSRFGSYEFFTHELMDKDGTKTIFKTFLSGLFAGVTEAVVALTPLETLKLKITNDMHRARPRYKGLIHGFRYILKREGIRGIYRGLTINVLKQGTAQALQFFLMVLQRDLYAGSNSDGIVPLPVVGIFGIISGAATSLGGTPMHVILERTQKFKSRTRRNTIECAYKLMREEGPGAFFKGSIVRMARICLDVALTFTIYESIMEYAFTKLWF